MATTATPCVLPELRLSRLSPPPACCLTPPSPPPLAVAAMGTVATEQLTTLHSEAPLASLGVWSYVHVTSRLLASAVPVHMLSGAEWMWQMAHTRTPSLSAASEQHEDARSVAAPRIHCVCVSNASSTCTRCSSPVLPVRVLCGLLITLISDCTESPPACALSSPPLLAPAALASRTCGDMTSTEQMVHVRIAPRARVKGSASRELTPVTAGTPMPVIRPTTRGGCPATAPIMFGNIWFLFGINVPRSRHPSIPSPDVAVANAQLRMRFCWATSLAPVGLLTQGDMLVDGASAPCPCRLAVTLLAPPAVPFAACASIWWYSFTSRAHRDGCVLCMMCDVCVCESDKTAEHKATVYALSLPYDALCFITSCRPTHRLRLSQPPDRLSDCLSSDSRTRLRGIALPVSPLPSMVMIPCEVNVDASAVCPSVPLTWPPPSLSAHGGVIAHMLDAIGRTLDDEPLVQPSGACIGADDAQAGRDETTTFALVVALLVVLLLPAAVSRSQPCSTRLTARWTSCVLWLTLVSSTSAMPTGQSAEAADIMATLAPLVAAVGYRAVLSGLAALRADAASNRRARSSSPRHSPPESAPVSPQPPPVTPSLAVPPTAESSTAQPPCDTSAATSTAGVDVSEPAASIGDLTHTLPVTPPRVDELSIQDAVALDGTAISTVADDGGSGGAMDLIDEQSDLHHRAATSIARLWRWFIGRLADGYTGGFISEREPRHDTTRMPSSLDVWIESEFPPPPPPFRFMLRVPAIASSAPTTASTAPVDDQTTQLGIWMLAAAPAATFAIAGGRHRRVQIDVPADAAERASPLERPARLHHSSSTVEPAPYTSITGTPVGLGSPPSAVPATMLSSRARRSGAWAAGRRLATVPQSTWLAISFAYQLRGRTLHRRSALARAAVQLQPLRTAVRYICRLRESAALRARGRPRAMPYDVGYDAETRQFSFRLSDGAISYMHPVGGHMPAFSQYGQLVAPMTPPADSAFVLRPEASGAWCYYDTEFGGTQWHAPEGSTSLVSRSLEHQLGPCSRIPPSLPRSITGLDCLDETPWIAIYQDSDHRALLFHRLTGAVRSAPWVALRTQGGHVYFANIVTRDTSWFPPPLWMEGWVMRPSCYSDSRGRFTHDVFGYGGAYTRCLLPPSIARLRVEGGAPYLGCTGLPQYPPDQFDSARSHPACRLAAPLLDPCSIDSTIRFGTSDACAVTHDMRRVLPGLIYDATAAMATAQAQIPSGHQREMWAQRQLQCHTDYLATLRRWQPCGA